MLVKILLKRIVASIPTLLLLTIAVFGLVKLVPGDPALVLLGDKATAASLEQFRHQMGLDQPIYIQYGKFMQHALIEGDLGRSLISQQPIAKILAEKFPATVELAVSAMVIAVLIGIPMGIAAAVKPGSLVDVASMAIAMFGVSMPIFWLGLLLIWIFALQLSFFPLSGRYAIDFYYEPQTGFLIWDALVAGDWPLLRSGLHHLVLPAVALATIPLAFLARITRASMLEVLSQDYVRTARAKGVSRIFVYAKHALKNAFIPVLTVLGLQFGLLLGGAIITETVFAWPGIGSFLLESVNARDYPALEGGILLVAVAFVTVNLVVDVLYRVFDPRLRVS